MVMNSAKKFAAFGAMGCVGPLPAHSRIPDGVSFTPGHEGQYIWPENFKLLHFIC